MAKFLFVTLLVLGACECEGAPAAKSHELDAGMPSDSGCICTCPDHMWDPEPTANELDLDNAG